MSESKPTKTKVPKVKKVSSTLIIEPHPTDYMGPGFVTLIQYRKSPMLAIVDNIKDDIIYVFCLDLCEAARVNEELIITVAAEWFTNGKTKYPLSVEFSQRGMTSHTSLIYRALNAEFVSRIIGPVPKYPMDATKSIKRRRRKALPPGIEIHKVESKLTFDQLTKQ